MVITLHKGTVPKPKSGTFPLLSCPVYVTILVGSMTPELVNLTKTSTHKERKKVQTMARIPMVTRTIDSTEVTIFCVNTEDKSTFTQSITMPGKYPDNSKLMKAIEKVFDGEPVKPISIESASVKSALYGMTEYEFLKYAQALPDRK